MNALLKLIYNADQAKAALKLCSKKKLMIVDKKHGIALDDEIIDAGGLSVNLGGYGTSFSVNIGEKFSNSWGLTALAKRKPTIYSDTGSVTQWHTFKADYSEDRGESLSNLAIFFSNKKSPIPYEKDKQWGKPMSELADAVTKLGGEIVKSIDKADIVVTLTYKVEVKTNDDVIVIDQDNFIKILPKPASERATPIKKITGDSNSLWKLLSVRDLASIQQGLELSASLTDQIDVLIEGCSVDKTGDLVRSKRFMGSGPALAYLDLALLGLLSLAPDKSNGEKLRNSLKILNLSLAATPKLNGYKGLESLSIEFIDNTKLAKKDLSSLGSFPKLKNLKISSVGYRNDVLDSLNGLDAPNLERIEISRLGLTDISELNACPSLKIVDLSGNPDLKKLDALVASVKSLTDLNLYDCSKVQSLDSLQGATSLRKLNIESCGAIKSLKPLSECTEFEELSVGGSGIQSLEGLENVTIKNLEVVYCFKPKNAFKLKDLISLKGPSEDPKFEISDFTIRKG